ncbi:MAG: OmpA family protein [Haliscomenobacter sp.]|nr:OmpA family protein [Haliscomenobacter sp.]
MARYPDFVLAISGHTDSQGSDTANLALSENRAKACLEYLASKGRSRRPDYRQRLRRIQPICRQSDGSKQGEKPPR